MEDIVTKAIQSVEKARISFSKFITANDVGATGAHQSGFHIQKNAWQLFFDQPGIKGQNRDKSITIRWQNDFETSSRFVYYGTGTRNEYRLTRFGKGFPYLNDDNIGDLLVITSFDKQYYEAFVLSSDNDIESFLTALNISVTTTNNIIVRQRDQTLEDRLFRRFKDYIGTLNTDFPQTGELAAEARNCYNRLYGITSVMVQANPDHEILGWLDTEFKLYRFIEDDRYNERIHTPFKSVEELIVVSNSILNRRKSRAGKSLEHHLSEIFRTSGLTYQAQPKTEENKRPDFLFPDAMSYHNTNYDSDKLFMLASKTTCKDRWRQILNEADRIRPKHLFTLQQGISRNQLEEMYKYGICLVVPKPYLTSFPGEFRNRILSLYEFIQYVKASQNN